MTIASRYQDPGVQPSVRGIASGVVFLAIFGTLWAAVGIQGLNGLAPWSIVVVVLIGLVMFGAGISLSGAARQRQVQAGISASQKGQRRNKWFSIVLGIELASIVIARVICWLISRLDLFLPMTMLIVGIHFFPLATLFRVKRYQLAGALLCLLTIITVAAVPEQLRLTNLQIDSWSVVLGFGGALILWGIGLAHWLHGRESLARTSNKP
jgi:hypothetical protein